MVLSNLGSDSTTLTNVSWLAAGIWYDVFDQSVYTASGTTIPSFDIPAYTAKVYSNKTNKELLALTDVKDSRAKNTPPTEYELEQNYPNPFNPSTTLQFYLPQQGHVKIHIYNILGKEIAEITNGFYSAGTHRVVWNGNTNAGVQVSSGVYFVHFEVGSLTDTKKIVLMK
jgi:hypothetical protein